MNTEIYFKINSETNEQELLRLYNTVAKRINVLRKLRTTPKAEEVNKKEESECLIKK